MSKKLTKNDKACYSCPNIKRRYLSKSRITESCPELRANFYYKGKPLQIQQEINHNSGNTIYKVRLDGKRSSSSPEQSPKVLKLHRFSNNWQTTRDFNAEKEILLDGLQNENIVQCYGLVNDQPYEGINNSSIGFLLEYCSEGDLQNFLKVTEELTQRRTFEILESVIKPIVFLHDLNIVHRDIKSLNYVLRAGIVKLCDFGLSRKNTAYNRDTTLRRLRAGPIWSAPELYNDEEFSYNFKSDVYSVTIVLWEVLNKWLTGEYKLPFKGNIYRVMFQITTGKRPDITQFPEEWQAILESGWKTDPEGRPTIQELLKSLKDKIQE